MSDHWQHRAACRDADPRIFDSSRTINKAIHFCARCAAVRHCQKAAADAVNITGGIWAGVPITRRPGPSTTAEHLEIHGTMEAVKRHRNRGETPCGPCRQAILIAVDSRYDNARAVNT